MALQHEIYWCDGVPFQACYDLGSSTVTVSILGQALWFFPSSDEFCDWWFEKEALVREISEVLSPASRLAAASIKCPQWRGWQTTVKQLHDVLVRNWDDEQEARAMARALLQEIRSPHQDAVSGMTKAEMVNFFRPFIRDYDMTLPQDWLKQKSGKDPVAYQALYWGSIWCDGQVIPITYEAQVYSGEQQ